MYKYFTYEDKNMISAIERERSKELGFSNACADYEGAIYTSYVIFVKMNKKYPLFYDIFYLFSFRRGGPYLKHSEKISGLPASLP